MGHIRLLCDQDACLGDREPAGCAGQSRSAELFGLLLKAAFLTAAIFGAWQVAEHTWFAGAGSGGLQRVGVRIGDNLPDAMLPVKANAQEVEQVFLNFEVQHG